MPYWPPTRGLAKNQLERFTLTGMTAANTDRGRLHGDLTATTIDLYRDVSRDAADKVASGAHAQPSTWTKITLAAANDSGLSGSCWVKYDSADATWEVYPMLATDTELDSVCIGLTSLYPKGGGSTFVAQHVKAREDFVRLMQQRVPPTASRAGRITGVRRGDTAGPWRVNSVGDYELVRLANVEAFSEWAIHWTIAMIVRQANRLTPDLETQLRAIEEEEELAERAWSQTIPLIDADDDMDADTEVRRRRISRG